MKIKQTNSPKSNTSIYAPPGATTLPPIRNVQINIQNLTTGSNCSAITNQSGCYSCSVANAGPTTASAIKITANPTDYSWDGYVNGVSSLDVVIIRKHILLTEPLGNSLLQIAADVNNSGSITTYDIILINQLILGTITSLPVKPWRFYYLGFPPAINNAVAQNPFNPLAINPTLGNEYQYPNYLDNPPATLITPGTYTYYNPGMTFPFPGNFYAIKSGNVSQDTNIRNTALTAEITSRSDLHPTLIIDDQKGKKGSLIKIPVLAENFTDVLTYQLQLIFNPKYLKIIDSDKGETTGFDKKYGTAIKNQQNTFGIVCVDEDALPLKIKDGKKLFFLHLQVTNDFESLQDIIQINRKESFAYDTKEIPQFINLSITQKKSFSSDLDNVI